MSLSIRIRLAVWYGALFCLTLAAFSGLAAHSPQSGERVENELLNSVVQAFDSPDMFTEFINPAGQIIISSQTLGRTHLPVSTAALATIRQKGHALYNTFIDLESPKRRLHLRVRLDTVDQSKIAAISDVSPGNAHILVTAISFSGINQALSQLVWVSIWTGLFAVLATVLTGLLLARSALKPISAITRIARDIARSGSFTRKLPPNRGRDELAGLAQAFNEMLESLEDSFLSQRRFVADASHELRAPLTTIRGNLDLLAEPGAIPAAEQEIVLQDVRSEVDRLSRLVNELLDLARADAGMQIKPLWLELDRLTLDVLRPYMLKTQDRRLTVNRIEAVCIYADSDRIAQLLIILLDNALHYTNPGNSISVGVWQEHDYAYLQVTDDGIGIAPEHLPHIFERFYRADAARSRTGGGTGLGLAIAQHIVESHGGEITVASPLGQGTTFTVKLPVSY